MDPHGVSMTLAEFYPQIKQLHVALVLASGALLAAQTWPMRRSTRTLSVIIDTLPLAAGVTLWWLLSLHPLHDTWLGEDRKFKHPFSRP